MTMNSPFLVTPQWLAQHINDENLVVIDVRMSPVGLTPKKDMLAEFERAISPRGLFRYRRGGGQKHRAAAHAADGGGVWRGGGQVGYQRARHPVIYDEGNQFSAPRGWWTFRNFGARHVYVLDEGLNGWAALGALETGPAQPEPQTFNARFNADAVVNMRQVEQALGTPVQISTRAPRRAFMPKRRSRAPACTAVIFPAASTFRTASCWRTAASNRWKRCAKPSATRAWTSTGRSSPAAAPA